MRYGICIGNDMSRLAILKELGYDYAEMPLCEVAKWSDEKVEEVRAEMDRLGIYGETGNGFFFGLKDGSLSAIEVDFDGIADYIRRLMEKASRLGLKVAVIGSGKARHIMDESRRDDGEMQFARVLRLAGDIGAEYGVKIVIEPLRKSECNQVNTVADGLSMCRLVNHPNVFVLADFFHVSMNGETMEAIENCGELLQHIHIARNNPDRRMPINAEDAEDVARWAAAVKKNGYNLRISLEGGMGDDFYETAKKMREVLKAFD